MNTEKKRKTRLKGTDARKPCFGCGKVKDRFKDFKPRWAGCTTHRTERGRRFFQPGCTECEKLVNGNIRQPRCITCDKARPKKQAEGEQPTVETPAQVAPEVAAPVAAVEVAQPKIEDVLDVVTVEDAGVASPEVQAATKATLLPEAPRVETPAPVAVATPEPAVQPAPEAAAVTVPPVVQAEKPAAPRKKVASKADLFALLSGDKEPSTDTGATQPPF